MNIDLLVKPLFDHYTAVVCFERYTLLTVEKCQKKSMLWEGTGLKCRTLCTLAELLLTANDR